MNARITETTRIDIAVRHGFRAAAISLALLMAGCGGGGGGSAPAAVNGVSAAPVVTQGAAANSFAFTSDDYGMAGATFLTATKSSSGIVLRAAVASSMTDQDFRTVSRIDVEPSATITAPATYSLGAATAGAPAFPGAIYFFNGHTSSLLKTVAGSISFTSFGKNSGDRISGSFTAVIEDGNDSATPKANYTVAAKFDYVLESSGKVLPAAPPVPTIAAGSYQTNCASCHALGSFDPTFNGASDLSLKGGRMNGMFLPGVAGHQGITLAEAEITALKILLNVN